MRLKKVIQGLTAGAAGTAAMTGHQKLRQRLARRDDEGDTADANAKGQDRPDPWQSAPAPARVGKRLIEGMLGWHVPPRAIPVLTQVMHWSYGTLWGGAYPFMPDSARRRARLFGPLFGLGVWAASYAQLVPLGIDEPPWNYPWRSLVDEIGYHVTYGTTVALTHSLIDDHTV